MSANAYAPRREHYDVIVIGAGIGGLVTAAYLTQAGKRVLCIEQHYLAGGNATAFKRRGFTFDVGVHYIGDCGPGGQIPNILGGLGLAEQVRFLEMDPDGFDVYRFPDLTFRVPRGVERFRERVLSLFPHERAGLDLYLRFLHQAAESALPLLLDLQEVGARTDASLVGVGLRHGLRMAPHVWRWPLVFRYFNATVDELLNDVTKIPRLRAILLGQHLTYGSPPSQASALLHGLLAMHWMKGSYYPRGGGQALSDQLCAFIEERGGEVLLSTAVERVLVEHGKAVGVIARYKRRDLFTVGAAVVVSNIDIKRTYEQLLPPGSVSPAALQRVRRYRMAAAFFVVYVGAKADLRELGLSNANYWLFPDDDIERTYTEIAAGQIPSAPPVYLTSATLKDPQGSHSPRHGMSSLEIMTIAPWQPESWSIPEEQIAGHAYHKAAAYQRKKEELAARLISTAETIVPGLRNAILYQTTSSPLTQVRYTRASEGSPYGIALIPDQYALRRPLPATGIPNLYLAGASCRSTHGIVGAMTSGVMAAGAILGHDLPRTILGGLPLPDRFRVVR